MAAKKNLVIAVEEGGHVMGNLDAGQVCGRVLGSFGFGRSFLLRCFPRSIDLLLTLLLVLQP